MEIEEITFPHTPRKAEMSIVPLNGADKLPPRMMSLTFSESMMQENIQNAETIITKWDPVSPSLEKFTSLFQENRREAKEFTKCVTALRQAMHFLVAQHGSSCQLVLANKLMKTAMLQLEKEFCHILSAKRKCLNPESISSESSCLSRSLSFSNSDIEECDDQVGSDRDAQMSKVEQTMSDLRLIAESMISSGYSKECSKLYRVTRKSIVEEELHRLGIRAFTQSQIRKMEHEFLEHQVSKWVDAAKVAVRAIFRGERLLCDHVFAASETIQQTCIAHSIVEGGLNLFRFPEFVAKSKRYPDKIFLLMNLFEAISDLWPEIELIFSYETLSPVRIQAVSSMHKLKHSVQKILSEFVSSIQKNSSKTLVVGGGIHPLTISVMEYVSALSDHIGTLSNILTDDGENAPFPESYFDSPSPKSGVANRLAWIILVLLCKLDSKGEHYKEISLSYLFLANNLQFVVDRVTTTALKVLLGQDWIIKLQKKVKLYATNYESVAWTKVLSSLPSEASESPPYTIKQQFRRFSAAFDVEYRNQMAWVVPNSKLRDEIKMSIVRKMVPAYREFYDRHLAAMSAEKNLEVLERFSPENLENFLLDLFHTTNLVRWNAVASSVRHLNPACHLVSRAKVVAGS